MRGPQPLDLVACTTGYWRVPGADSLAFEEMLDADCAYVAGWSPWRDAQIPMRTVPALIGRPGAS